MKNNLSMNGWIYDKFPLFQHQVNQLKAERVPLEGKVAELSKLINQLESDKVASEKAASHWKQRVTVVTEKYDKEKQEESNRSM